MIRSFAFSFLKGPRVLRMTDFACRHPPASLASRPCGAPWQRSCPDNGLRRLEDARSEERRHSKTSSISPSHRSQASLLHWSMDINGSCIEGNWLILEPFKNGGWHFCRHIGPWLHGGQADSHLFKGLETSMNLSFMATMDLPGLEVPQPVRIGTPGRWKTITKIWPRATASTWFPASGSIRIIKESQHLSICQPLAAGSLCRMVYLGLWKHSPMLLPCDYWPKLVDPLIKDGGTTKSAKSQLIKMHLCEVSINTSVMDPILKCAPSNCSKMSKTNHQAV